MTICNLLFIKLVANLYDGNFGKFHSNKLIQNKNETTTGTVQISISLEWFTLIDFATETEFDATTSDVSV